MSYLTEEQRKALFEMRDAMDAFVAVVVEKPVEINSHVSAIRVWKPGIYSIGEVRTYNGVPYKCVQAHDSTSNTNWTPDATPALWMQYHGTSVDTARPWVAPTGAHDMYKTDEYMIWTDGKTYHCISDTAYSPDAYASAWEVVE